MRDVIERLIRAARLRDRKEIERIAQDSPECRDAAERAADVVSGIRRLSEDGEMVDAYPE